MKYQHLNQSAFPKQQRGIATILIVVLIGVALTATAMGIMHSIRSAQQKQVAVHAVTHAQTGVWAGAEAFRRYLGTLNPTQLGALTGNMNLSLDAPGFGSMTVQNVGVQNLTDSYRVTATIVNAHGDAKASAAVTVVYDVEKVETCPGCVMLSAALDFHDDLDVGGQITFNLPAGAKPNINVDGNVSMMNVGAMSLGSLRTTGNVSLDSNMRVEEVYSNGNVSLTGDARALKVTNRGTVVTGGSGGAQVIWANGAVTLNGTYRSDAVNTRSTISVNPPTPTVTHGTLKASSDVTVRSYPAIESVQTKRDVIINAGTSNPLVTSIIGERNLLCTPATWNNFTSVSVNGVVQASCTAALLKGVTAGAANSVTEMNEIQPITIPRMVVDVWTLKQYANYVFEWDAAMNRTKVTVKNINSAPDGVYWIGKYADNKQDYLCKTFNASGLCLTPASTLQMCIGHSEWNPCLTPVYNTTNKTWTFDGKNAVPGILWFKGNVFLNNGYNYGTVLATGNVKTGGLMRIQSVNYAGFNAMCKAETGDALYKTTFSDQYPTNLCDMGAQTYKPMDVGNIAIAAGGYDPAANGVYSGGDIDVGTNNQIYGIVLAGGYLATGGQTEIYGHVSAAVQGGKGSKDNILSGNTTVDLTRGNTNYNPAKVPDMTGGACPDCEGLNDPEPGETKLLWSKYL